VAGSVPTSTVLSPSVAGSSTGPSSTATSYGRPTAAASLRARAASAGSAATVVSIAQAASWSLSAIPSAPATSSTRSPSSARRGAVPASSTGGCSGTLNQNVLPRPASLTRPISPPSTLTSSRLMARPSPVPPKRRVVLASAWVNGSNRPACCSSSIPMPVSDTSNRTGTVPGAKLPPAAGDAVTVTCPLGVNFTALPARLSSTWRSLPASPLTVPASAGSQRAVTVRSLLPVASATRPITSSSSRQISKSARSRTILPASSLLKSSTSLITDNRATPALLMPCA
jgi:hypothetical protein